MCVYLTKINASLNDAVNENEVWNKAFRSFLLVCVGAVHVVFILLFPFQVSLFGYGADPQGNWHHYWEDNKYAGAFRKTGVHNADFESEIIHKLCAEGKIKLYPQTLLKKPGVPTGLGRINAKERKKNTHL